MSGEWAVAGYRHVRALGDGSAGRVVLAVREATDTPVAIRYLPPRRAAGPGAPADEVRLVAGLEDDGLVRLQEYAESPHGAALVSELVDGIDLERLLKAEGRLSPEASLVVFKAVLLALGAAHRAGVMHGSVAPGRVLVTGDGASKLAGLGVIAWDAGAGAPPRQRAPELWAGGRVTPAADIYAATAIFYECLTGEPPLPPTADGHRTGAVSRHGVPEPLVPLVMAGLAKDPNDRPVTAPVFLGRLDAAALAAYGSGWEQRGRAELVERAAVLRLLFPLSRKLVSDERARAAGLGGAGRRRARGGVLALVAAVLMLAGTGAVVYASGGSGEAGSDVRPGASGPGASSSGAPAPVGLGMTGDPSAKFAAPSGSTTGGPSPRGSASGSRRSGPSGSPSGRPSRSPSPSATPSPDETPTFVAATVEVIALALDAPGTTATAQVKVTGSGKGPVTVSVQFYAGEAAHGAAETLTVQVNGEATVHLSHSYDACPGAYAGEATAAPGTPAAHRLTAEGDCSTA